MHLALSEPNPLSSPELSKSLINQFLIAVIKELLFTSSFASVKALIIV
ncbi:hypothetical protein IKS57_01160 [bacterium]|nr:hypothetical protein [bacterium]